MGDFPFNWAVSLIPIAAERWDNEMRSGHTPRLGSPQDAAVRRGEGGHVYHRSPLWPSLLHGEER